MSTMKNLSQLSQFKATFPDSPVSYFSSFITGRRIHVLILYMLALSQFKCKFELVTDMVYFNIHVTQLSDKCKSVF